MVFENVCGIRSRLSEFKSWVGDILDFGLHGG